MGEDEGQNPKGSEDKIEHGRDYSELYSLCYRLEAKVNKISATIKWIAFLTILIAVISLALSIGNAVAGCGCKHSEDCACASQCLSGWAVAALVLGVISAALSFVVALIGIFNDKNKEQVFGAKKSVTTTPDVVEDDGDNKKKRKEKIELRFALTFIFFFSFLAAIFSFTLLLLYI